MAKNTKIWLSSMWYHFGNYFRLIFELYFPASELLIRNKFTSKVKTNDSWTKWMFYRLVSLVCTHSAHWYCVCAVRVMSAETRKPEVFVEKCFYEHFLLRFVLPNTRAHYCRLQFRNWLSVSHFQVKREQDIFGAFNCFDFILKALVCLTAERTANKRKWKKNEWKISDQLCDQVKCVFAIAQFRIFVSVLCLRFVALT